MTKKFAFQSLLVLTAVAVFGTIGAAQDPSWHSVPKEDLSGNRGEIARSLQNDASEAACLQIVGRSENDENILYLKMLAGKRLGTIGTKNAIGPLVAQLDKEKEGYYARYALETIPGPEVDAALCESLKNLKNNFAIAGALTTLGVRVGYFADSAAAGAASAETAKGFLTHADADVRKAAAYAFACCAGDAAVEFFTQKGIEAPLSDSGFLLAEIFFAKGEKDKAIKLYDALAAADIQNFQKEAAVYRGILARGNAGIEMLVAQLNSESPRYFAVGLKAARELPAGAAVTKAMIEQLGKQTPERKALLVRSIGDRKDAESQAASLPIISEAAKSGDEVVRIAAIESLKNVGDASVLPILIAAANQSDAPAIAKAAQETLADLPGKAVDDAIVGLLEKGDATTKTAAIGLVEQRRIISAFPLLQKGLKDSDATVRKAAMDALGQVASIDELPMLLDFMTAAESEDEQESALKILKSACTRMPQDVASAETAKRFEAGSTELKVALLDLLKEIGGAKAMEIVEAAAWSDNADLQDKATAVLGSWRSPQDIDLIAKACLKLAKDAKSDRFKRRGLSGYLRLARQFNMSEERRLQICKEVFELSKWDDIKTNVIDVYWRYPSLKMLETTMQFIGDDKFKEAACKTAVTIGERLQGKSPVVADAMKKVIETTTDNGLKDKAKIVLDRQ